MRANWMKLIVGLEVKWISGTEKEVWEGRVDKKMDLHDEEEERRERKRVRKVVAGRTFGGCWERKLGGVS